MNEFKVKKGLIIEGASGGTALDVQGSQGQLFSVTDSLTGSIFAVSDISGVPIFDVNSSGISYFDGNVGIGTASPLHRLEVVTPAVSGVADLANIDRTSQNLVRFVNPQYSTSASMGLLLRVFPDSDARQGAGIIATGGDNNSATNLSLFVSKDNGANVSTSYAAITALGTSGNIGIGTVSPDYPLDVVGNIRTQRDMLVGGDTFSDGRIYVRLADDTTKVFISSNSDSYFNGGDIGIGTTAPDRQLEVYGVNDGYMKFDGGRVNNHGYTIGSDNNGFIIYDDTLSAYRFVVDQDTGNVGIGTTAPVEKLDVYQSNVSYGVADLSHVNGNRILINPSYNYYDAYNHIFRGLSGTNTHMTIDLNGSVGIGTTSPGSLLHLASSFPEIRLQDDAYTSTNHYSTIDGNGGSGVLTLSADTSNAAANSAIVFKVDGSEYMRVDDNGNVGIGTTSPDAKLHVESTSATGANFILETTNAGGIPLLDLKGAHSAQLRYKDENDVIQGRVDFGDSGIFNFIDVPNNSSTLYLKSGGNVGIGTTSPKTSLDIVEDSDIWHLMVGGLTKKLLVGGQAASGDVVLQAGAASTLNNAAVTTAYNLCLQRDGGNVGVGTSSPGAKLDIVGDGTNYALEVNNTSTGDAIKINTANATGNNGVYWNQGSVTLFNLFSTSSNDTRLRLGNATTNNIIHLSTNADSWLNGGDIGIGNTAPAYKLDVTGTIRATGNVIAYSDARVKENVETIPNALEKVNKLRGVSYTRKDISDKSTQIGVIAQEVLEVLPEVVSKDKEGKYSVAYGNVVGLLIEAIKEQDKKIERLEGLVELMLKGK